MDDPIRVQVVEWMNQLLSDLSHLIFWQTFIILENLKKLALGELRDYAKLMCCLKWI